MSEKEIEKEIKDATKAQTSPLRCVTGAVISGALSFALYNLTMAISTTFANKPISYDSQIVYRITLAVRTLVVGMAALGMGIFGLVAVGLLALGLQIFIQQTFKQKESQN